MPEAGIVVPAERNKHAYNRFCKTKTIIISIEKGRAAMNIIVNGEILEQVTSFSYFLVFNNK